MGMGMGMAMADRMARRGPWGEAPGRRGADGAAAAAAGGAKRWHVAKDGQTTGPFTRDELGRMAAEGTIDPDSWLWTPGRAGLAARPRRRRARRPLQRPAAAAAGRLSAWSSARSPAPRARSSTASPARPAAPTCATRPTSTG